MKIIDAADTIALNQVLARLPMADDAEAAAAAIIAAVRDEGDAAITRLAAEFDGVTLAPDEFRVSPDEVAAAAAQIPDEWCGAIDLAHANVRAFSAQRIPEDWRATPRAGVNLGERFVPLASVAAYIPGGTAPLVSTIIHTITMAQSAGVERIVVTTPVRADKQVNPAMLYAASVAGATEVYRLGGVYAIAALAYGTETISAVEKIVGPGNAYVAAAKRQVYGRVALDLVAGPSEVLIMADDTADPRYIAADLLAQAEHGSGREQAVLVSLCPQLTAAVAAELSRQTQTLARSEMIAKVVAEGVFLINADEREQALAIANAFAPEHLEIMTRDAAEVAELITAAGAIFVGPWTPEPVGDFVAGPSHVLPTGGTARFFAGLTVDQFYRRMSVVQYEREALAREASALAAFAAMEQLDAHGRSVSIRFDEA